VIRPGLSYRPTAWPPNGAAHSPFGAEAPARALPDAARPRGAAATAPFGGRRGGMRAGSGQPPGHMRLIAFMRRLHVGTTMPLPLAIISSRALSSCVQNNRALVQSSLATLDLLVRNFADAMRPKQVENLLTECAGLVNERDLHLAYLAFGLVQTLLTAQPTAFLHAKLAILPPAMALVQSSLIQGHAALGALREFCAALVRRGDNPQTHIDALLGAPSAAKHAFPAIAQCIGTLCQNNAAVTQRTLARFAGELRDTSTPIERCLLGLLCIGEIGRLQVWQYGGVR